MKTLHIESDEAMQALGARLARASRSHGVIYLQGELGTGKTTLVRGLLRGLGHEGAVKSPTFTLVEPYTVNGSHIYHFDLYRLSDPEELEFMGLRDYFSAESLCLIEWPQRGGALVPPADLLIELEHAGPARDVVLTAHSAHGEEILNGIDGL
ncbi:tRNA (adenosine(37)-N6)-threonylcarbamoyltransferase complex ATPase subunit type 1 TsaE [Sulfuriflexus sp.]|uniref:tRNA (adenosine(37)-N6)-threonylcarbamoyltransferase complex ATPase subunit type 1 TsaE n=1 Tax=Sulfuriflexus sp. TaxID=2015443 RepID=UPI0028CF2619|nr:tRNA (adenosine(37)-N6)-threonylcarbamoyltransferase complex ATPase subunit type 1 TsaE [Sulfuriflexus sp.]MDT8404890.1 tRNA (adenosine(37)-N6)-threonylcarbamoyltransferase complex ATPase subunit type 1 TsaE [Sulfuriflexus sp.]